MKRETKEIIKIKIDILKDYLETFKNNFEKMSRAEKLNSVLTIDQKWSKTKVLLDEVL